MARLARIVVPGYPHHVTQRGNRRQETFFCDEDYRAYLRLMAEWCAKQRVEIWAYCLMPNHVHLIGVPPTADGLCRAIGEAHRRYTRRVNFREGWRGHLWQGRFASFVMDEPHLLAAARYVERNPVRARLCKRAQDYAWSSAAAHVECRDDVLVKAQPLLERTAGWVCDWGQFISQDDGDELSAALRGHERTGRPLGGDVFVGRLEETLGRVLRPQKPGPKAKTKRR